MIIKVSWKSTNNFLMQCNQSIWLVHVGKDIFAHKTNRYLLCLRWPDPVYIITQQHVYGTLIIQNWLKKQRSSWWRDTCYEWRDSKYFLLVFADGSSGPSVYVIADANMLADVIDCYTIPGLGISTDVMLTVYVVFCRTRRANQSFFNG